MTTKSLLAALVLATVAFGQQTVTILEPKSGKARACWFKAGTLIEYNKCMAAKPAKPAAKKKADCLFVNGDHPVDTCPPAAKDAKPKSCTVWYGGDCKDATVEGRWTWTDGTEPIDIPAIQEMRQMRDDPEYTLICGMAESLKMEGLMAQCLKQIPYYRCEQTTRGLWHTEANPPKYFCRRPQL